jgi:hypothetical protein
MYTVRYLGPDGSWQAFDEIGLGKARRCAKTLVQGGHAIRAEIADRTGKMVSEMTLSRAPLRLLSSAARANWRMLTTSVRGNA